ncbi:MAG: NAD(+)--dinitrogen-reductase ADP-D-ribosyltransferase [Terrimicrobiaceae bacterium]|nr:NAD(+)--dinitrogen-reductase ADP-D-ribosyltransferase [Terrimicrobiaceae bacterium]
MPEAGTGLAADDFATQNRLPNIFTLANHAPWVLSDLRFQSHPRPLHIGQTRRENKRLFALLAKERDAVRRGEIFHEYLTVQFSLHEWETERGLGRSSLRNSYIRYLRGWAVDSNTMEGAVLKAWVFSRFGLHPAFHHENLSASPEAGERYEIERIRGQAKTNAIFHQLDLLFEFCQYEIKRRHPGASHLMLYRGTFDAANYPRVERREAALPVVRLNNLSSFTSDRETAWEFGSTVWEIRVPLSKIFFFSGLLPTSLLRGENEYLVLGGEYEVRAILF